MVSQAKLVKLSSAMRELLRRIKQAKTVEGVWEILSEDRDPVLTEAFDEAMRDSRRKLLIEVANLRDDGIDRFRRNWSRRFRYMSDVDILTLRRDLRSLWLPETSLIDKQRTMDRWAKWRPEGFYGIDYRAWIPLLAVGRVVPDPWSLHAQLGQAVLEQERHFACCCNPGCPAAHFLARRKDQKYCEQGECSRYGQRQFALDWWNREGKNRRARKYAKKQRRKALLQGSKSVRLPGKKEN